MRQVIGILCFFNLCVGLTMALPLGLGFLEGEKESLDFLKAVILVALVGGAGSLWGLRGKITIGRRGAFAIVSFGWLTASIFGAVPFVLSGSLSPLDALFEVVSGFTTTGASVIPKPDEFPKSLLLWRSMVQWLGGMGIILLGVAVLPLLGVGGIQLYRAEVPGPFLEKLRPKIADTARLLWQTYLLITLVEIALLAAGGMSLFDAVCHSFTTMATGGFSTRTESIAFYDHYHRVVIIFFMFLAATNFSLHYAVAKGTIAQYWIDREFRLYFGLTMCSTLLVFAYLMAHQGGGWLQRLEDAAFQVVSIVTTTGYATADFDKWPPFCNIVLLLLMFVGGCAGSTGGGIKCVRFLILYRYLQGELRRLLHPQAVVAVKIAKQTVPPGVVHHVLGMTLLYLGIFAAASTIMTGLGLDLVTSVSSVAATLGNIGPGLAQVGPTGHYADIPALGKCVLMFCMLAGRLEIYTVFVLLFPEFWKK